MTCLLAYPLFHCGCLSWSGTVLRTRRNFENQLKHFLFGINNCFVELEGLAHSYPKLKMSSAHYADEQNIKIRYSNDDSNPPSSTDEENENVSNIDAEMLC